jgi:uncharacterized RDD family membrane protein YckC
MQNSKSPIATPTIKRRLISMVYEAFLFIAVELFAIFIYLLVTRNQHTPIIDHGRNAVFFLVGAAYFIHSWAGSGHTLAMKTWRIKVVKLGYKNVPFRAAAIRYLMAWGWFLPAIVAYYALNWSILQDKGKIVAAFLAGIAAWAATALFDKDRQFLHDRVAGTPFMRADK